MHTYVPKPVFKIKSVIPPYNHYHYQDFIVIFIQVAPKPKKLFFHEDEGRSPKLFRNSSCTDDTTPPPKKTQAIYIIHTYVCYVCKISYVDLNTLFCGMLHFKTKVVRDFLLHEHYSLSFSFFPFCSNDLSCWMGNITVIKKKEVSKEKWRSQQKFPAISSNIKCWCMYIFTLLHIANSFDFCFLFFYKSTSHDLKYTYKNPFSSKLNFPKLFWCNLDIINSIVVPVNLFFGSNSFLLFYKVNLLFYTDFIPPHALSLSLNVSN